jgi:hypothetical protein
LAQNFFGLFKIKFGFAQNFLGLIFDHMAKCWKFSLGIFCGSGRGRRARLLQTFLGVFLFSVCLLLFVCFCLFAFYFESLLPKRALQPTLTQFKGLGFFRLWPKSRHDMDGQPQKSQGKTLA